MAHELTHWIKDENAGQFDQFCQIVTAFYERQGVDVMTQIEQVQAEYRSMGQELSREEAYEEVICRSMEGILDDGNVFQMMMDEVREQDKGLWEKICEWFKDFADKLRSIVDSYRGAKPETAEGQLFQQAQDYLYTAEVLYAHALVETGKNQRANEKTAREGGVRYSTSGKIRSQAQADMTTGFENTVDQVLNGTYSGSKSVVIGYTPELFRELGVPSLPVVIGTGHIYSAAKTEAEARQDGKYNPRTHYHGLGRSVIKTIYEKLSNPEAIIASKDVTNGFPVRSMRSVVCIVDVGTQKNSLLLPVEITVERQVNGISMDVNVLSSVYDKKVDNLIREAVAQENAGDIGVFYIKKAAAGPVAFKGLIPKAAYRASAYGTILHRIFEKVNLKIQDQTQTRQFAEWFGDWQNDPSRASKVVNPDGMPKVMYRGDTNDITVLDRKKTKPSNLYGRGFYFTDSKSHASQYGAARAYYLDVKHPVSTTERTITRKQMRRFLEAVADDEDYGLDNYGYGATVDSVLKTVFGKSDFAMLQDVSAACIGDLVAATELFNKVNGTNYDGFILPTETVVFQSNQVKSATDNVGTFDRNDPDIRYSQNDPSLGDVLAAEDTAIKEDIPKLRELVSLLKSVRGGLEFSRSTVESVARVMMKNNGVSGNVKELADILEGFYDFVSRGEDLTLDRIQQEAREAGQWMKEHRKTELDDYAREALREVRGSRIALDEEMKQNVAHTYGSYNDFRKSLFGTVVFTDKGVSLDSLWIGWSREYPSFFPPDTNSTDMPEVFYEAIGRLRSMEDVTAADVLLSEQELTREVYDSYSCGGTSRCFGYSDLLCSYALP